MTVGWFRRRPRRRVNQCLAPACERNGYEEARYGEKVPHKWCKKHLDERRADLERLGGAKVLQFADYERDELTGHLHRRTA